MFLSFLYIFFYIFSTKTNTSRFLHFTPHILHATSPLSLLVIFPWQENNYSSRLQKWNKLSILILLLPCSLVNLMMTDKLYMLLVASSLDGSTSAIMASWNRKSLLWRISAKSFLSFLRISLSVALLGNSMKPILVKGFPLSPSFTVLRMFTGSLTVYDSSVRKEKIWILAKPNGEIKQDTSECTRQTYKKKKKPAKISRQHHVPPRNERLQKFHTDDVSLPRSGWCRVRYKTPA